MVHSSMEIMNQTHVDIKGTSDGLIIHVGAGDWNTLLSALADRLAQTPAFFRGGRVALDVGPRQLTTLQIESIGELLGRYQVSLWAILSESGETQRVAGQLGLETALSSPLVAHLAGQAARGETLGQEEERALLVKRILRSGQHIHHEGPVVLIGDVNPGAEVVSTGDVLVWGRLRGNVHAGADGNDQSVVCALSLSPMLLRIGHHMARSPGDESVQSDERPSVPEVAFVHDGQIVAQPWREMDALFEDWRSDLLHRAANTLSTWF